jgi:predicted metal-dependent hydrolase
MGIIVHELAHHMEKTQGKDFKKVCVQYGGTNCDIHETKK